MNYFNLVNEAIAYIEDRLDRNLSVGELAARHHISKFYFTRIFKALTKQNVKEYIDNRKMAEAARKLATTRSRIIDIALDLGYASHEAFTRKFKGKFGVTPAEFRKTRPQLPLGRRIEVVEREFKNLHQAMIVEFELQTFGPFPLWGRQIRFNPDCPKELERVTAFYDRFLTDCVYGKGIASLYHVTSNQPTTDETFDYFAGFRPEGVEATAGLEATTIPASEYAVFRYKNSLKGIHRIVAGDVWNAILLEGLNLNPVGIHFFELYERGYQETKQFKLYVPVLR